jgi:hypothetical protein
LVCLAAHSSGYRTTMPPPKKDQCKHATVVLGELFRMEADDLLAALADEAEHFVQLARERS